jgi:hypothetical protein
MRFAVMIDLRFRKCVRVRNGTRPPYIDPSTFRPDIRKRSGMTEGPISGYSISPIHAAYHAIALSPRAVASSDTAHAAFVRRDMRSSKHLRSRLSPSAIRAVSIAPYPSMMPAWGFPSSGKD